MTSRQTPAIILEVRDYGEADRLVNFLTPATCGLLNPVREKILTQAFCWLRLVSQRLRKKYQLL
ncbi:MAG: recombination protein O N-terminal domain-containing protein [Desulfobaccales bacterium]